MGRCRYKEHPRYTVICVRISDEEREALEKLSLQSNKKVSELLREALLAIAPERSLQ